MVIEKKQELMTPQKKPENKAFAIVFTNVDSKSCCQGKTQKNPLLLLDF